VGARSNKTLREKAKQSKSAAAAAAMKKFKKKPCSREMALLPYTSTAR